MSSENIGSETVKDRGINRRTVVRTAVWTVPAISIATAAPAMAATSTNTLAIGAATTSWNRPLLVDLSPLSVSVPVTHNSSLGVQATGLSVVIDFTGAKDVFDTPTAPTGWTVVPSNPATNKGITATFSGYQTFTFTYGSALTSGVPVTLNTSLALATAALGVQAPDSGISATVTATAIMASPHVYSAPYPAQKVVVASN